MTISAYRLTACSAALLALCSAARGDGMMAGREEELGRSGRLVASPKQEAILVVDGNTVHVTLRTHFRGAEEVAWVVPVPARPTDIKPGDDAIFAILEEETAPRFYRIGVRPGLHLGCVCAGAAAALWDGEMSPSVRLEEIGTAGIFDYAVLSSRDANELARWLRANGYAIPAGAAEVFESYVRQNWHWLAMRVRAEDGKEVDRAPHPITYAYRSERLVYPLAISRLSADEENEIVLYVAAPSRYAAINWPNRAITELQISPQSHASDGTNYQSILRTETANQQGRLFFTEYCGAIEDVLRRRGDGFPRTDLGPWWKAGGKEDRLLTRLRAVMSRSAMDRDVSLDTFERGCWLGGAGPGRIGNRFQTRDKGPSAARLAAPLGPMAMASLGVGLIRRRRRWAKRFALPILAMACAGFAML
jgi:hypothetical protein